MTDDNIIGIDGRQAGELRKDQAEREQREQTLRQRLKIVGFEIQPGMAPNTYTIAHPHPPQPPYLNGWRDLSWAPHDGPSQPATPSDCCLFLRFA